MTGHQINSLVGDLVAMAQAMERLPQVEHELASIQRDLGLAQQTVQRREESILEYKGEIEALHAKLREAEVAKDQAETMFLESDDKFNSVVGFLKGQVSAIATVMEVVDPPKPLPEPQPEPVKAEAETIPVEDSPYYNAPKAIDNPLYGDPQGQSEPDPIAPMEVPEATASTMSASNEVSATQNQGPYSGRRYIDYPGWVSREDWLAGGGTNEDYDWREGDPTPAIHPYSGSF